MSGRGKWSQPGVPHKGWSCTDIEDLGEPSATCEMCEVMAIRYVHHMEHPDYPDMLGCGCVCAGNMEQDLAGARLRERNFRARQRRQAAIDRNRQEPTPHKIVRWDGQVDDVDIVDQPWAISERGNPYRVFGDYHLVVYPFGSGWQAQIKHLATARVVRSGRTYPTCEAAKSAALDGVQRCIERNWR
jgi:hypothetical protein